MNVKIIRMPDDDQCVGGPVYVWEVDTEGATVSGKGYFLSRDLATEAAAEWFEKNAGLGLIMKIL